MGILVDVIALPFLSCTVPAVIFEVLNTRPSSKPAGTVNVPVMMDGSSVLTDMGTSIDPIVTMFVAPDEMASLICATIVRTSFSPTKTEFISSLDEFSTLKLSVKGASVSTESALFANEFTPKGRASDVKAFPASSLTVPTV